MTTASDGSPVAVYARLPDRGEGELVAAALAPPASVLELGCGTGRMTRQLLERGYTVTALDESAEMLAHVPPDAETVRTPIEGLDLGRRFDLVLLASNLLSVEPPLRREFLATCARHAGLVVVETLPLGWEPRAGESQIGDVRSRLSIDSFEDGLAVGSVEYEVDGRRYVHAFEMHVFPDEAALRSALADAGFRFERWLDRERGWFTARA